MEKRIYLSPPHMGGEEIKYVKEAFDSNWIAPIGPNIDAFEKEMCDYVGMNHALAVTSGTAGIHLALRYLGVGPGDYVFCSDLTFIGSCAPILYQFANPVFIDAEEKTWNMCPIALEKAFQWAEKENKMPKAVIIVDLYGQSADYDQLLPICRKYGVPVIEDAAEALGASYKGKKCGTFGDIGIFSFNGNKIITTSGGGMVVTNNEAAFNKMKFWATQAREPELHYEHVDFGYNYRMSNVLAGIGRGQLKVLNYKINAKKTIYNKYKEKLNNINLNMMPVDNNGVPNYWLSVASLNKRAAKAQKEIIQLLSNHNIESRPVWKPMHLQPLFSETSFFSKYNSGNSFSSYVFLNGICLPSGSSMSFDEQHLVINLINNYVFEEV